jgi:hypothetical protein
LRAVVSVLVTGDIASGVAALAIRVEEGSRVASWATGILVGRAMLRVEGSRKYPMPVGIPVVDDIEEDPLGVAVVSPVTAEGTLERPLKIYAQAGGQQVKGR